jgi:hypothetical protein
MEMEQEAVAILMFIFSGCLMFYAALLFIFQDYRMIMRHWAAKMKNRKAYTRQFAKLLATVALAPLLAGIASLYAGPGIGLAVLLATAVAAIAVGVRFMKDVTG